MDRGRLYPATLVVALLLVLTASAHAGQSQPPASPPQEKVDMHVTVSGFAQLDYRRADPGDLAVAPHELNIRRARLGVSGNLTRRLSYTMVIQGDNASTTAPLVLDLEADVTFGPWLKLRFGQYKYDFDMDARWSDSATVFMDRPFVTNSVAGSLNGQSTASSGQSIARDRGAAMIGTTTQKAVKWGYAAGIYQGTGRSSDNNGDFSYTLQGNAEVHHVKFTAGYLHSPSQDSGAPVDNVYSAWTTGLMWENAKSYLRGEYYDATRDLGIVRQRVRGYYALGGHSIFKDWDVFARFQYLKDGQFVNSGQNAHSTDLGVKYLIDRRARHGGTYVSFNVMFREADDGFVRGMTLLNDGRGAPLLSGADVGTVGMLRLQVQF